MTDELTKAKEALEKIEEKHNVKILFSSVCGSRAYGTNTKNSDYDTHFIFVHPEDAYISLDKPKDYIEDSDLDVNGWELGKYLRQFSKSSYSAFEWLMAPQPNEMKEVLMKYRNNLFVDLMESLVPMAVNYVKLGMGFLGYADREFGKMQANEVGSDKYNKYLLSFVRMLLNAKYCKDALESPFTDTYSYPLVDFWSLVLSSNLPENIDDEIFKLLNDRRHGKTGGSYDLVAVYFLKLHSEFKEFFKGQVAKKEDPNLHKKLNEIYKFFVYNPNNGKKF